MKEGTQPDTKMLEMIRELGLTEYEARIYFALVSRSPMTANDISVESGVPMSKIYALLDRLENGGWVSVIPERPKKYRAVDPKQSIDQAYERAVSSLGRSKSMLTDGLSGLYEKSSGAVETSEFQIIYGNVNILNHIKETARSNKTGIRVMMAFSSLKTAERINGILKDVPGNKQLMIIHELDAIGEFEEKLAGLPYVSAMGVEHKWFEGIMLVFTKGEGMYSNIEGDEFKMALVIRDTRILDMIKKYVEYSHPGLILTFE